MAAALWQRPAHELARLIATKEVSPLELTRGMLERIDRLQPTLNAFITVCHDAALVTALPVDQDPFEPIEIDGAVVGELRSNLFPYTLPFNITGHPAMSVPCGFGADGLPVGLQIVGRLHEEATLLRLGALYEAAERWTERWPPL